VISELCVPAPRLDTDPKIDHGRRATSVVPFGIGVAADVHLALELLRHLTCSLDAPVGIAPDRYTSRPAADPMLGDEGLRPCRGDPQAKACDLSVPDERLTSGSRAGVPYHLVGESFSHAVRCL